MRNKVTYSLNILTIFIMLLSYLVPLTQIKVNAAAKSTEEFKIQPASSDSYKITRQSEAVTLDDVRAGDHVVFTYDWSVPDNKDIKKGDTYHFDLPKNVTYKPIQGSINSQGKHSGNYSINEEGKVTFTFEDLSDLQNIKGSLSAEGTIKKDLPKNSTLEFDGFPNKKVDIQSTSPDDASLVIYGIGSSNSSGETIIKNSQHINSEAYVNRSNKDLNHTNKIISNFDTEKLSLDSLSISTVELNLDGSLKILKKQLTKDIDYVVEDNDNVRLNFTTSDTLKINYSFTVKTDNLPYNAATVNFKQSVTLSPESKSTASAETKIFYDNFLDNKYSGLFGNYYYWNATYNYNHKNLPQNSKLTINTSDNTKNQAQYLKENELKIYRVLDTSQKYSKNRRDLLTKGVDYDVSFNSDYTSATITFKNAMSQGMFVDYTSVLDSYRVPDSMSSVDLVTTAQSLGSESSDKKNVPKNSRNNLFFTIYQQDEPIDYNQSTAFWHYDINTNRYENQTFEIKNDLPDGLTLADDPAFELKNGSKYSLEKATKNTDGSYTVTDPKKNASFKIIPSANGKSLSVIGTNISNRYFLLYNTKFDATRASYNPNNSTKPYYFTNTATATITNDDSPDAKRTITSSDNLNIKRENHDGYINSHYDIKNKIAVWDGIINPSKQAITNSPIINEISDGKILKLDVYKVQLKPNGEIDESSVNSDNLVESKQADSTNLKQISYTPENGSTSAYLLRLTTSLDDVIIDKPIENTLSKNGEVFLSKTLDVPNTGSFLDKSGTFNQKTKQIDWKMEFNKSQSELNSAIIYDDPSDNQEVIFDTIKIKEVSLNQDGNPDGVSQFLKLGVDYDIEKKGRNQFEIHFKRVIEKFYEINYSTSLTDIDDDISNDYNLVSMTNNQIKTYGDDKTATVEKPTSQDMEISGKRRLAIHLHLKDKKTGAPLANSEFQLVNNEGNRISFRTTDSNGNLTWDNRISGIYLLKQISSIDNYIIPEDLKTGIDVNLGAANTDANNVSLEVENEKPEESSSESSSSSTDNSSIPQDHDSYSQSTSESSSSTDNSSIPQDHDSYSQSTSESSSSTDNSSIPQDHDSYSQSSFDSNSKSNSSNNQKSGSEFSQSSKPQNKLPQTGQNNDLTLKYIGIIIILLSGFILYPALKKRR